ncbi:hypothetical protein L226DRAFT_538447 [Lentinus tigrinus ALCF2SS1-7]|uniref:Uncharacterized protein n=1 Tax=Lentinus tigrinus ALCF2SS1-6 TaxID=1328759 RepID=A0A5C2RZ49_9APHY|nr:hypothetical protein L227DRAFT_579031 [Lentinus tigrinus ALCF2SS1-6]RPD71089.1 hypothetical protein L226DRAFT_538447 [Lentinus tigrinus ALCF2SS1-7]
MYSSTYRVRDKPPHCQILRQRHPPFPSLPFAFPSHADAVRIAVSSRAPAGCTCTGRMGRVRRRMRRDDDAHGPRPSSRVVRVARRTAPARRLPGPGSQRAARVLVHVAAAPPRGVRCRWASVGVPGAPADIAACSTGGGGPRGGVGMGWAGARLGKKGIMGPRP